MHPDTRSWLDGLREFAASRRLEQPPAVAAAPPSAGEQAAERMILSTQLSTWLSGFEDVLAARRAWLAEADPDGDPDPAIVITTSAGGVAVAEQLGLAGSLPTRSLASALAAVTELEYRLWCIRRPDEHGRLHVNVWNWIKMRVPRQRQREFSRHPLAPGEVYWLHRAGIAGAGSADRRDCHLWKWNGRHATLLEAFVSERGVSGLTGPTEG
jgi:hypothetical protein